MSNVSRTIQPGKYGLVNKYDAKVIPRGSASNESAFVTKTEKIELVRGRLRLGPELTGSGKIVGLHVGEKANGDQVLFARHGQKVKHYNDATDTWTDIKTDLTDGEETAFGNYHSLAGAQTWMGSHTDGLFKIMTANPGSITDLNLVSKNYKGKICIKDNRMYLWFRKEDKTGLYLSYIDAAAYTTVTGESVGTGDGSTKTFSGTLAFKAAGARRTCFGVSITDGTETFTDNYSGTLTGSAGGTGTINYTTGAYSVTFNAAPANLQAITASYQWEDSTNTGVADFSKSAPRTAGQGATFRQDVGGDQIQNVMTYGSDVYSLKRVRTYRLTLTNTDTDATNLVYRERAGIPNWGAACETEEGVFFIDDSTENTPKLRILKLTDSGNNLVEPVSATEAVDLTGYLFDKCDMEPWGDYVVFTGRKTASTENDTVFVFNRINRSVDLIPWPIHTLAVYNGSLIGGESISNNVYVLFSGLDDDGFGYQAKWESNYDDLSVAGLKKAKRLRVEGEIGVNQKIYVYVAYDDDNYQLLIDDNHAAGAIDGSANYVDRGQSVAVGAATLGRFEIGGGSDGIIAYHYSTEFRLNSPKFKRVKVKFEIHEDLGYASVTSYEFYDIRYKVNKLPSKYR